jgi:hypothetical protein
VGGLGATVAGGLALNWSGAELLETVGAGWSGVWAAILLAGQCAAVLFGLAVAVVAIQDLWASAQVTGPILRLREFDGDEDPRYYAAVDDGHSRAIPAYRLSAEQYKGLRQGQLVTVVATRYLGRVRSIDDAADADTVLEVVA